MGLLKLSNKISFQLGQFVSNTNISCSFRNSFQPYRSYKFAQDAEASLLTVLCQLVVSARLAQYPRICHTDDGGGWIALPLPSVVPNCQSRRFGTVLALTMAEVTKPFKQQQTKNNNYEHQTIS